MTARRGEERRRKCYVEKKRRGGRGKAQSTRKEEDMTKTLLYVK